MERSLDNLRVVLVGTRNPLNVGAAARAMSNFGVRHLRLVRPYEVAFREARSAVGAAAVMASAVEYDSVAEAVADCQLVVGTTAAGRRELQHELRRLEVGGRAIRKRLASAPVALLFGSEKRGLSNDDMSHCHWLMRIPTCGERGRTDRASMKDEFVNAGSANDGSMNHGSMNHGSMNHGSMNLGQAVAVCLYELVRARKVSVGKTDTAGRSKTNVAAANQAEVNARAGDLDRITRLLFEALDASGYVKPRVAAATEEKLRRMVRRMNLSEKDAETVAGDAAADRLAARSEGRWPPSLARTKRARTLGSVHPIVCALCEIGASGRDAWIRR